MVQFFLQRGLQLIPCNQLAGSTRILYKPSYKLCLLGLILWLIQAGSKMYNLDPG
jgi:hypothetical protein